MTAADTPDHIRGGVSATRLLGQFGGFTRTATVALPPNTAVLWLFVGPPPGTPPVTVLGASTGVQYPAYQFPIDNANDNNDPTLVVVAPEVDSSVIITWAFDPDSEWFVIADAGPRVTVDAALAGVIGTNTDAVPGSALQVAGSDGTDLRTLLTDATGKLQVADAGLTGVSGTPNAAAPAKAVQVGGSDGTDLRVVLTDATGRVLSIDQVLKLAIGAPAAAAPADAVQVAGSDGTDLRTLRTDGTGALVTTGGTFPPVYAAPGAVLPADALLIGGSDGTDLRPLATDTTGHQLTIDQNLKLAVGVPGSVPPADVLMLGGTDGTDVRAIGVSAIGTVQTSDAVLEVATALVAGSSPARALQQGVSDGTHLRAQLGDQQGVPYSIATVPSILAGDHPPNELLFQSIGFTSTGVLLGAAGAGKRYRVFAVQLVPLSGTFNGYLLDTVAGVGFALVSSLAPFVADYPPSGLPLASNAAVDFVFNAGTGSCAVVITYTLETI